MKELELLNPNDFIPEVRQGIEKRNEMRKFWNWFHKTFSPDYQPERLKRVEIERLSDSPICKNI